jgi:hypothetical protein
MERTYNDEVYEFHSSSDIIRVIKLRRMRWMGHAERVGGMRISYTIIVWRKSEIKGQVVNWSNLTQGRSQCSFCVNALMNLQVTQQEEDLSND